VPKAWLYIQRTQVEGVITKLRVIFAEGGSPRNFSFVPRKSNGGQEGKSSCVSGMAWRAKRKEGAVLRTHSCFNGESFRTPTGKTPTQNAFGWGTRSKIGEETNGGKCVFFLKRRNMRERQGEAERRAKVNHGEE